MIVRLAKASFTIFIATFAGVTLARLLLVVIFPSFSQAGLLPGWQNFVFSLCIAFNFGFGIYFYEISQARLNQTKEQLRQRALAEEKAKTLATEAQLALLESRIHPHFLFNTLNSIAALIREEPVLAEKMVERLSALLRYSLDSNTKGLVRFSQELEIARKYLEIEKIRFGEWLNYRIEIFEDFESIKIPSLSLQTLVENSIKHVASKNSGITEIVIFAEQSDSSFYFGVSDTGAGFFSNEIKEGHGLDNLRKRLNTIFGDKADLEILENGTGGNVRLKIPVEK